MAKPSVGRIVHYVSAGHSLGTYSSTCRAAIVTDIKSDLTISVAVIAPKGTFYYEAIDYDAGKAGGSWHWPEMVEGPTSSILPSTAVKDDPPPRRM